MIFAFGQQGSQEYSAEGSGVIYRADGMIITNEDKSATIGATYVSEKVAQIRAVCIVYSDGAPASER